MQHAVLLFFRLTLSLRDVEEMLAQMGVDVSYETIGAWTVKFGPKIGERFRPSKTHNQSADAPTPSSRGGFCLGKGDGLSGILRSG